MIGTVISPVQITVKGEGFAGWFYADGTPADLAAGFSENTVLIAKFG